jgi:two-component system response regulator (stage 0 sporulation protein A)
METGIYVFSDFCPIFVFFHSAERTISKVIELINKVKRRCLMGKPIEVIVADDNGALCDKLREFYSARSDIIIVATAGDGETALKLIEAYKPDLILLDIIMPRLDGLSVLHELRKRQNDTKALVITAFSHRWIAQTAAQLGAAYYLVKPFDFSVLSQRIKEICRGGEQVAASEDTADVSGIIAGILDEIGIPANLKGYEYIKTAVFLVLDDWSLIYSVTNQLYPEVGRIFHASGVQVERSIRHAIEYAFLNGDVKILERYFGSTSIETGRPSNACFIGRLVELVKLNGKATFGS